MQDRARNPLAEIEIPVLSALKLRPRLILAIVVAIVIGLALPTIVPFWSKCLIGWCVGVILYMVLVVWQFSRSSLESVRRRASALDDSAPIILVVAMAATIASFGGIAALLLAPPGASPSKAFDIVLAGLTMVLSWMFMQVMFAVHYTHIFYGDVDGVQRGGLQFGGEDGDPDFWDMLYFTTSIGATAQTSDTVVTTKTMRRIVLAQAVYSFFFNTAVLALAINIAAGLAGIELELDRADLSSMQASRDRKAGTRGRGSGIVVRFVLKSVAGLVALACIGVAVFGADLVWNRSGLFYALIGRDALIRRCTPPTRESLVGKGFSPVDLTFGPHPSLSITSSFTGGTKTLSGPFTFNDGPDGPLIDGVVSCTMAGTSLTVDVNVDALPHRVT